MSRINGKAKGALGERQLATEMSSYTLPSGEPVVAHRGCQHAGGVDTPDVKHNVPGIHVECKRCEKMPPSKARSALLQAKRYAEGNLPVVVWRSNRTEWVCMLSFADFMKLLGCKKCDPEVEKNE